MTPLDAMMARKIAMRAYAATIEEIARLQKTIVDCEALVTAFGPRALPPEKMLRGFNGMMKKGGPYVRDISNRCAQALQENYALAELLEERFEAEDAASMEAFARDMAARMRPAKRKRA